MKSIIITFKIEVHSLPYYRPSGKIDICYYFCVRLKLALKPSYLNTRYSQLDILYIYHFSTQDLRSALDRLLEQKIAQPQMKLCVVRSASDINSQLLHAIIDLITTEESTSKVQNISPFCILRSLLSFFMELKVLKHKLYYICVTERKTK